MSQPISTSEAPQFADYLISKSSPPPSPPPSPSPTAPPTKRLTCLTCRTHLTTGSSIISKTFTGRHGRAYLLSASALSPRQVVLAPPQQRHLVTGIHTVRDFSCRVCSSVLGWRYVGTHESAQAYKIGKWILEREKVGKEGGGGRGVVEEEVEALMVGEGDVDLGLRAEREKFFRGL